MGKAKKKDKSQFREFLESILIAGVLAFFIITFVVQSFVVEGPSMEPSFYHGERLFVNKFIYRFREPERGEVIVFEPRGAPADKFIKRVIGLPGETLEMRDGEVYINGEVLEEDYTKDPPRRNYGPYEIKDNEVFVLGDNRSNSSDSRFPHVGMVEYNSISGKAFWVYWPIMEMRVVDEPSY